MTYRIKHHARQRAAFQSARDLGADMPKPVEHWTSDHEMRGTRMYIAIHARSGKWHRILSASISPTGRLYRHALTNHREK